MPAIDGRVINDDEWSKHGYAEPCPITKMHAVAAEVSATLAVLSSKVFAGIAGSAAHWTQTDAEANSTLLRNTAIAR